MSGLLAYSGLATKIKAMHGKLLTESDYMNLSELTTVGEVVNYLRRFLSYENVFSGENENGLGRIRIEQLLHNSVNTDYEKIYRFANNKQKEFLKVYFIKYEILIIKMCIRLQYSNSDTVDDGTDIFARFFERWMSINIEALVNSKSLDELVGSLVTTPYYQILKVLQGRENVTLYDYEVLLDIYYFKSVWKAAHVQLGRDDMKIILKSYGTEIDLLNMQWIYRAKKYYGLSEAEIYAQIIPVYYKLHKKDIMNLVSTSGDDAFLHALQKVSYASKYHISSPHEIERIYTRILNKIHDSEIRNDPYSIACIDSYFYSKEVEVEKLIKLIECVMYGKNKDEIIKNIIAD